MHRLCLHRSQRGALPGALMGVGAEGVLVVSNRAGRYDPKLSNLKNTLCNVSINVYLSLWSNAVMKCDSNMLIL